MSETITPRTTKDWISLQNKYNISREDAPAVLEEASTKIAKIVKEAIDAVGNGAINANDFLADLAEDLKERVEKL